MTELELYILRLKFGIQQKRLFLEGPGGPDGRAAFEDARAGLTEIGDKSLDFDSFFGAVIEHFAAAGFMRIAH